MLSILKRLQRRRPLKHIAVTTFHPAGYDAYGRRFIETFLTHWPEDVGLLVYAEDVSVEAPSLRVTVLDQRTQLPKLVAFKEAYRDNPYATGLDPKGTGRHSFRWDAVRFSNKVFAVTDAVRRTSGEADQLLWLDADTLTHSVIPHSFLDRLAPRGNELTAYLNRKSYPECGWVGYNLGHPLIGDFVDAFEQAYLSGRFLTMKESHDSFVFWVLMREFEKKPRVSWKGLGDSKASGHIFVNSELGKYMDHLKGARKSLGKSQPDDLQKRRTETWWQ